MTELMECSLRMPVVVIFDCDGVLIDSEIIVARAHASALAARGHDLSVQELLTRFTGVPDREMYVILEREWGRSLPSDYDSAVKAAIASAYEQELQAIEGVHEAVAALKQRVCVASSSTPEKLRLGLSLVGLYDSFTPNIFSASQVARGKPAPDIFLFAAGQMGTSPAECLVVEDSVAGVAAARAAGMPVIGFTGASHCLPDHGAQLIQEGAFITVQHMKDLPGEISKLHA